LVLYTNDYRGIVAASPSSLAQSFINKDFIINKFHRRISIPLLRDVLNHLSFTALVIDAIRAYCCTVFCAFHDPNGFFCDSDLEMLNAE
jgi:hypothetical protein